jgi:hypothetical protein
MMNVRKHLAGFALFSLILGSAIFINYFLTLPDATIPPVPTQLLIAEAMESPRFTYKVRQVSLDLANGTGYTTLRLRLRSGEPAPESIWVRTSYFSPDIARSGWSSMVEIRQPFASGEEVEIVAADSWHWEVHPTHPTAKASYFAHVDVASWPSDVRFSRDMTTATPVVMHWPDEEKVSAPTIKKFSR